MAHPSPVLSEPTFTALNPTVLVSQPTASTLGNPLSQPSVILFFGSMDADVRLLRRHVNCLLSMYPTSTMYFIHSFRGYFFSTTRYREEALQPVVDGLRNALRSDFRGVYIHVHSNGGMFQFMSLRNLLSKSDFTGIPAWPTVPSVLVMDSVPGDNGAHAAVTSAALPVPNPVKRWIFIPTAIAAWWLVWLLNALDGNPPMFEAARDGLNSHDLLPHVTSGAQTVRLYLYSPRDRITLAEDIETHAEEARRKGHLVHMEKFERSWHITHAREYPERYWKACTRVWRQAAKL
ncbi:hypothetical protein PENSPDRAFT_750510 [Peniophora sp. CONT]|nr:hypothetical protein PENSPDRAFT_750510 [Peniophora sp. CONT]